MHHSYQFGLQAEERVMQILHNKGYEKIAHRYKTKHGEIDLIVQRNNIVHFLEIKARKNFDNFSIREVNLVRINDAISCFLAENEVENFQIGVVLVNKNFKFKYINNIYLD